MIIEWLMTNITQIDQSVLLTQQLKTLLQFPIRLGCGVFNECTPLQRLNRLEVGEFNICLPYAESKHGYQCNHQSYQLWSYITCTTHTIVFELIFVTPMTQRTLNVILSSILGLIVNTLREVSTFAQSGAYSRKITLKVRGIICLAPQD